MTDLSNQTVMITGGTGNVGRGVVNAFVAAGANVVVIDMDQDRIDAVLAELDGSGHIGFAADLSDADAVAETIAKVPGGIDHLVHTVGGFAMGDPVHAGNVNVFDRMMALNARMTYLVCGKVAAHMIDAGKTGSISMILARAGEKGSKNMGAYIASKAAATRIMESMAAELKDHHIRVNGISPSIVDTPPNRDAMASANFDNWVKPAQIGDLAVFLATNAAMTGENVAISAWS